MLTKELLGKTITNIYSIIEYERYGLDTGECFIEVDNKIIIDIPFGEDEELWSKELDTSAKSIFSNNDTLDYIKNKKITDLFWYDGIDKGFILLENGYIISETTIAPNGTGLAGLNIIENVAKMIDLKGKDFFKLTDKV